MKQCFVLICFVLFAFLVFFALPAGSEPVDGYNSYIELLPGGRPKQLANEEIISKAQTEIVRSEALKRERKIRFLRPIDIVRLNPTYIMVSFEVSHTSKFSSRFSKKPAVFFLLFEGNGPTGLKRYAENYIKWFGSSDIELYNKSTAKKFCDIFIRAGVDDCYYETIQSAEKKEAPATKSISADLIQSGIVKAEYIDQSVVTEHELNQALTENHARIMEICSTADTQIESINTLRDKIRQLEEVITSQTLHAKQLGKVIAQQHAKTQKLEETLAQQHHHSQKLETTVHTLKNILKGVSRSKNEILFSGMNLHIVNGTGRTHGNVNGTGNLIVGYNEKKPGENLQMESHEIIAPVKTSSLENDNITEKKPVSTATILEEIDSKLSGVCFIDTVRF